MRTLLTVLLLLLIPLNLHAQEPAGGEGAAASFPHFESAYFKNGHIEFKPSVKFDWESGASEKIKSINTGKPTQKDIDYIKSGDHFFPYYSLFFELGVPGDMSKAFYYLITNDGIIEIKPVKLRGTARFKSDPSDPTGTAITDVVYFGYVVADPVENRQVTEGGFVMTSMTPVKISSDMLTSDTSFTVRIENKKIIHTYSRGTQTLALSLDEDHPVKIITSYKFKWEGTDSDYIFVKWDKDDQCNFACCSKSYSLFQARQELREVKWTRYDCDI